MPSDEITPQMIEAGAVTLWDSALNDGDAVVIPERTCRDLAALVLNAAVATETNVNWQPINTAPLDGTQVILRYASGYIAISSYAKTERYEHGLLVYSNEGWRDSRLSLGSEPHLPTHWMPLPDFTPET